MSSRLLTSALIRRRLFRDGLSGLEPACRSAAGVVIARDSARPASAASGVRRSCERAASSELRRRSDSICMSTCWAYRRRSARALGDRRQRRTYRAAVANGDQQDAAILGLIARRRAFVSARAALSEWLPAGYRYRGPRAALSCPAAPMSSSERRAAVVRTTTIWSSGTSTATSAWNVWAMNRAVVSTTSCVSSRLESRGRIRRETGSLLAIRRDACLVTQPGGHLPDDETRPQASRRTSAVPRRSPRTTYAAAQKSKAATLTNAARTAGPRPALSAISTTVSRNSMTMLASSRRGNSAVATSVVKAHAARAHT